MTTGDYNNNNIKKKVTQKRKRNVDLDTKEGQHPLLDLTKENQLKPNPIGIGDGQSVGKLRIRSKKEGLKIRMKMKINKDAESIRREI